MVTVFAWKKEYSVEIPEIDAQHRQLVAILEDLNRAMRKAEGHKVLEVILDRLQQYATEHFATEERLFKKYRYPEEEDHKREHDEFLIKLAACRKAAFRNGKLSSTELMQLIEQWFVDHMQTTDYRYVPFFQEVGNVSVPK